MWLIENFRLYLWLVSCFCWPELVSICRETSDGLLSLSWNPWPPICPDVAVPVIPLEGREPEVTPLGSLEWKVGSEFFLEILSQ